MTRELEAPAGTRTQVSRFPASAHVPWEEPFAQGSSRTEMKWNRREEMNILVYGVGRGRLVA